MHGGAGGVGAFAVQLAKIVGAHVTATVRGADVEFVRALGAERVVDVDVDLFDAGAQPYDVVIDTVGGVVLDRSYAVLRRGGRLVTLQGRPSKEKCDEHGISGIFFVVVPDRAELAQSGAQVDTGALQIAIAQIFPLAEGRVAFESGSTLPRRPGKTILVVRG